VFVVAVDGDCDAGGHAGDLRGHVHFVVEGFYFVPVDFQADQGAFGAFFCFADQGVAADEIIFFQID